MTRASVSYKDTHNIPTPGMPLVKGQFLIKSVRDVHKAITRAHAVVRAVPLVSTGSLALSRFDLLNNDFDSINHLAFFVSVVVILYSPADYYLYTFS